jgi:acyl-CoA thioester hydrolase
MFSYSHPIHVRYRDLDPQGHVNNTVYLTYLECARLGYYQRVGIYHPDTQLLTGLVVARNEIDYLAPIQLGQAVRVGLRVDRLGTHSITFDFQIETDPQGVPLARGKSVMVAYDNEHSCSIPIPADWREKITHFEAQEGNHDPA